MGGRGRGRGRLPEFIRRGQACGDGALLLVQVLAQVFQVVARQGRPLLLPGAEIRQSIAGQPASLLQEAHCVRHGRARSAVNRGSELFLQAGQGLSRRQAPLRHQQVNLIQTRAGAGQLPFRLRGGIPD